jgi:hypothetical protein
MAGPKSSTTALAREIAHIHTIPKLRKWGTQAVTRISQLSREDQTQVRLLFHGRLDQLRHKQRPKTILPAPKAKLMGA